MAHEAPAPPTATGADVSQQQNPTLPQPQQQQQHQQQNPAPLEQPQPQLQQPQPAVFALTPLSGFVVFMLALGLLALVANLIQRVLDRWQAERDVVQEASQPSSVQTQLREHQARAYEHRQNKLTEHGMRRRQMRQSAKLSQAEERAKMYAMDGQRLKTFHEEAAQYRLEVEAEQRREAQERRALREQQDRDYAMGMQHDLDRAMAESLQDQLSVEASTQQQLHGDNDTDSVDLGDDSSVQHEGCDGLLGMMSEAGQGSVSGQKQVTLDDLPAEPSVDEPHVYLVITGPTLQKQLARRFNPTDTVENLLHFLMACGVDVATHRLSTATNASQILNDVPGTPLSELGKRVRLHCVSILD
eukprot:m.107114 g.107114  ORF g.107114 m.107114 type:complete len:358 (-) comp13319_c1_seq3:108-1181(-)